MVGQGAFSRVHQCIKRDTGEKFAVKAIMKEDLTEQERVMIESEWEILTLCEHPNILRGYEKYETKSGIYLVT